MVQRSKQTHVKWKSTSRAHTQSLLFLRRVHSLRGLIVHSQMARRRLLFNRIDVGICLLGCDATSSSVNDRAHWAVILRLFLNSTSTTSRPMPYCQSQDLTQFFLRFRRVSNGWISTTLAMCVWVSVSALRHRFSSLVFMSLLHWFESLRAGSEVKPKCGTPNTRFEYLF